MVMAMMQVINDADVADVSLLEPLDDLNLIGRLTKPTAVIVEPNRAAQLRARLRNGPNPRRLRLHAAPLLLGAFRRFPPAHHPQFRLQLMPLDHVENQSRLVVQLRREPPGDQPDMVPLQRLHLRIKGWDLFGALT